MNRDREELRFLERLLFAGRDRWTAVSGFELLKRTELLRERLRLPPRRYRWVKEYTGKVMGCTR